MRYLIVLEPTETGIAVQVPDLAIVTYAETLEAAKEAARIAIEINRDSYRETGQKIPDNLPLEKHFENPDLRDLLFAYIEVSDPLEELAA